MPKKEGEEVNVNSNKNSRSDVICTESSAYRNEIIETIDTYQDKLKNQRMNKNKIKNRLKLLQMREKAHQTKNLPEIEKELWAMAVDIEAPNLRLRRNISVVIILYTCLAVASFVILTVTEVILLPSFNVPYSVLLMGLIGSLVSMYVKLPSIKKRDPWNYDSTIWFIISPPVAVIMAGIFFGIVQIFLPVFKVELSDESWLFWILAWVVGFVNWVYLYDRLSGGLKKSIFEPDNTKSKTAKITDPKDN